MTGWDGQQFVLTFGMILKLIPFVDHWDLLEEELNCLDEPYCECNINNKFNEANRTRHS